LWGKPLGSTGRHGDMTLQRTLLHSKAWCLHYIRRGGRRIASLGTRHPLALVAATLVAGAALGASIQSNEVNALRAELATQDAQLEDTRADAQREVNALPARLGELQAEALRLTALGDVLT